MSVDVRRDPLTRHVVVNCALVEVAKLRESCRLLLFTFLAVIGDFLDEERFWIELKLRKNTLNPWLEKVKEGWHLPKFFVNVDIVGTVFELIAVVLHPAIEKLAPLVGIEDSNELFTLLFTDEIVVYHQAGYQATLRNLGIWEINDLTFLKSLFMQCRVKEAKDAFVAKNCIRLLKTAHHS